MGVALSSNVPDGNVEATLSHAIDQEEFKNAWIVQPSSFLVDLSRDLRVSDFDGDLDMRLLGGLGACCHAKQDVW